MATAASPCSNGRTTTTRPLALPASPQEVYREASDAAPILMAVSAGELGLIKGTADAVPRTCISRSGASIGATVWAYRPSALTGGGDAAIEALRKGYDPKGRGKARQIEMN